eukprot:6596591-Pyramimonas_sp.AAC.1
MPGGRGRPEASWAGSASAAALGPQAACRGRTLAQRLGRGHLALQGVVRAAAGRRRRAARQPCPCASRSAQADGDRAQGRE